MLNRLFVGGLAVVIVGVIAGQSYRYGHAQGERSQASTDQAIPAPTPPAQPAAQPRLTGRIPLPTPDPPSDALRIRIQALERSQALQVAASRRRAREAAEIVSRLSNRLASLQTSRTRLARRPTSYRARYGSDRSSGDRTRYTRRSRSPRASSGRRTEAARSEISQRVVVVEHVGTVNVNPCPSGEKLISATCLPAGSIIRLS